MIIRTNEDNIDDPKPKSEDLWDGQLCFTSDRPFTLFLWDDVEHESRILKSDVWGRDGAQKFLNSEDGYKTVCEELAEMFEERTDDDWWSLDDLKQHPACEVVAGTIDVGTDFLAHHVYDYLHERYNRLPDDHFASHVT